MSRCAKITTVLLASLALLVFGFSISVLAEDGGETVRLPIEKSPEFQKHDPPIKLQMQVRAGAESNGTKKLVNYWNENYADLTGIKVSQIETARSGYYTKINNVLFAQDPKPDIVLTYNIFSPLHAETGTAVDLTEWYNDPKFYPYDMDDIFPVTKDLMTYKGKIYGVPTDTNTFYLYYRKDLMEEPPVTWGQLLQTARRWTKKYNSDSPTDYGLAFYGKRVQSTTLFWYQIFKSMGGNFFTEEMEPEFSSQAGIDALNWVQKTVEEEVVPPDISTYGYPEILGALQTGKVAMAIQWGAAAGTLFSEEASPKIYDKIAMTYVPGHIEENGKLVRQHNAHNLQMEINAASKHKKAAFKFLAWAFGSSEGLEIYAGDGWNPPHFQIAEQEKFKNLNPRYNYQQYIFSNFAYPEPMFPDYPATKEILTTQLLRGWTGGQNAKTLLKNANEQIKQTLRREGYYE